MPINERKEKGICDFCPDFGSEVSTKIQEVMGVDLPHVGRVKICKKCLSRLRDKILHDKIPTKKTVGAFQ